MKNKKEDLGYDSMNFWRFIKEEIFRIANITIPEVVLQEIKELNEKVNGPKIKYRVSGNYAYFYIMDLVYDPSVKGGRRKRKENLGKISKNKFESNKKTILKMSKEELKKTLEAY